MLKSDLHIWLARLATRHLLCFGLLLTTLWLPYSHAAFDDDFMHARAAGMASAYAALASDGDGILINPAGIWQIKRQLALTQASLYRGLDDGSSIQQQLASYVYHQSSSNTLGLLWKRLSVSSLYSEDILGLGYARHTEVYTTSGEERTLRFSYAFGTALRALRWDAAPTIAPDARLIQDLAGPVRLALDIGLIFYPSERVSVAVAFQNLNQPDVASENSGVEERLPIRSHLGLSLRGPRVQWLLDLLFEAHQTDLRTGVEWAVSPEHLYLRAGAQLQNLAWGANLTLGAGYRLAQRLRFDYAFMMPIQGIDSPWGSHRLSAVYDF